MSLIRTLKSIYRKIRFRLVRRTTMFNVNKGLEHWPKALLHYKTTPFFDPMSAIEYHHTNSWEILELSRILTRMEYRVDVVDRAEREWIPEDEYSLVIGNATGNSGQRYAVYCRATPSAHHILYATGPHVDEANALVIERYTALESRTGIKGPPLRVMDKIDMAEHLELSQSIMVLDGNGFSSGTYVGSDLPTERFFPSVSPAAAYKPDWGESRDLSSFFCFCGNGFIAKGVDLLVEAFLEMPDLHLTIAGPSNDATFWSIYGERIEAAPNIDYVGFVEVGGSQYEVICSQSAWSIFPTAAEAACTSVATTLRSGLVPVVTYGASIETGDFGVLLPSKPSEIIAELIIVCPEVSKMGRDEYLQRVEKTLESSRHYTQESYSDSTTKALKQLLAGSK